MQSDLCSAGPNDKTLKVKKSTMGRESVHSKDNKLQNWNVKLSLASRNSLEAEMSSFQNMRRVKDGRSLTCSYTLPSCSENIEHVKVKSAILCFPCHTQRPSCWFHFFYILVFTRQSVIPAIMHSHGSPWTFSHCIAFVSAVWWIFTVYAGADTVRQAETNWSRGKQISVSQSGSSTLSALWRVSKQRSLARFQTISEIPVDGWESRRVLYSCICLN